LRPLFVINGMGTGGAERSLSELLLHADLEPTVVCLHRREEGVQDATIAGGVPVRFVDATRTLGRIRELRAIIRRERPDLVHTTIFEADVAGRLACAGLDVPVVTSLVNPSYERVRASDPAVASWRLRATRLIDGWTARRFTSHFHAITNAVKEAAVRDLGIDPARVTVIERGRDPERLGRPTPERRRTARSSLGLGDDALVIVTAGRQEFQKGQWHLVEAMPAIRAAHPSAELVIAGRRGNASSRVTTAIERCGVGDAIHLLGHRDDLPEVLAAADLFVFPSLFEGLGGVLIEAMALGLPIVASDIPATREVLDAGGNADLVEPGDASALATSVIELLDDPARRAAYARRGRQLFEERFTLRPSIERMLELLERVASGPASRPAASKV
jgi:glycosyltransferase involved in cell wall biosynthesis